MPASNPLFDDPKHKPKTSSDADEAVNLIRSKIDNIYAHEPDAEEEASEAESVAIRSKHQEYMHQLMGSGKSLAQIQTAWHEYYQSLPDSEKHEVWQEFYHNHAQSSHYVRAQHATAVKSSAHHHRPTTPSSTDQSQAQTVIRTASEIKQQILHNIQKRIPKRHKHHIKSLGFGLAMGTVVLLVMMFGFFNERFIAPFITPSKSVSSTPIIVDSTAAVGQDPKLIIPKINVEIPVVYDEPSIDEAAVQRALEGGVLHYATTPNPGEQGNAVIFGHSSNNILNKGKYKFAFVLLKRLENGDTFMLEKDGKRYIYKVFEKRVVTPEDISVLDNRDRPTVTLITCDPPGTSVNRLIVVGEQISPDPASNVASSVQTASKVPEVLPSDAPTLWSRFWDWISS